MEIIPAIDIINGKCVRLSMGDYSRMKTYADDPVGVARKFMDHGIRRLHLVDLDGAKAKHIVNLEILEQIAKQTRLKIDFGGGVKSDPDIENAFRAGASMVTGGSVAVKDPGLFENWVLRYGPDKIILGADVKDKKIAVSGWQETSEKDIFNFLAHYRKKSIKFVICTDVAKDGVMQGPAFDLYREIIEEFPDLSIIASGGVTTLDDIDQLRKIGVWGVIIGKAIYEGKIDLNDLKEFVH